jgi:hypothetical protein
MNTTPRREILVSAWMGLMAAVLMMVSAAQAAEGTWTNAAGGTWGTAGNWKDGVIPDNGHANLTLTGVTYTVAYDAAGPAISNLIVRNKAGSQTTLNLSAPFSHAGGFVVLSTGAVVTVTNNAVWTYRGTLPDANTTLLDVSRGASLEVCGGLVQFTNIQRAVASAWNAPTIQIGNASTGTLRITSGQFNYWTPNTGANDAHEMYVGNGTGGNGTLELAQGGTVILGRGNNNKLLYVGREGGRGRFIVAGDLIFTNKAEPRIGTVISVVHGSYGEMIVTNAGRLIMNGGKPRVGVDGNCTGLLRLSGTNYMPGYAIGWEGLFAGQCDTVNGTSTGLVELTSGSIRVWGGVTVGIAQGAGRAAIGSMNISGGLATFATSYNTWIGAAGGAGNAQGTLNMSGGTVLISNGANNGSLVYPPGVAPSYGYSVAGLIIGQVGSGTGNTDDTNPSSTAKGTLNLSGGVITNQYQLVVGCNGATGIVNQTGGTYVHVPIATDTTNMVTLIGYSYGTNSNPRGGTGTYNLSGGTFTTPRRVFVGGVPTNIQWFARGGAVGLLKVTCGTFTCGNTLFVGENGSGTVTMGSNGVLSVGNLYATNATSKLRFELGSAGIGTFTVTNELRIGSASKLEVDMTGFTQGGLTKILDCKSRSGSFDASNITVTGGKCAIVQTKDEDIYLNIVRGTLITFQ